MQPPERGGAAKTELPKPAALREGQEIADTPGTSIFDTSNVSIYYGSFRAGRFDTVVPRKGPPSVV
jgi:hypothetical protein